MKKMLKTILTLILLAVILSPFSALAKNLYYTNISGSKIHVPVHAQVIPIGASAQCKDNTYSFSAHRSGTCSGHKGVKTWYK